MLPDLLVQIYSRHAVYMEGAKTQAQNELDKFLRALRDDLIKQLQGIEDLDSIRGRRLTSLLKAVRKTIDAGMGDYEKAWRNVLEELAEYESGFTTRALGQVVNADFTLPAPSQVLSAAFSRPLNVKGIDEGQLLATFFENWTAKTRQRVEGAIRLSIAQGESLPQMIRRLRGTRAANYRDGILDNTRRELALMTRTAHHHVATQARVAVYEANSDIIKAEEFVAVLDGRTSALCRGLSGEQFKVGKGPMPPLHMACRSMRVPVLKDGLDLFEGAGRQFSRGADGIKRVDADMTYYDWIKTQPPSFQDSVLGETRGRLLRDGGLTAERFQELQLDKNFRPRTLKEIRELEPEAFARAGL